MSVLKTAIAMVGSLSKAQVTSSIIPLLATACKDDIPNVKIALCRLIPELAANHADGKSIVASSLKDQLGDLKHDSDTDVKFFANEALESCS